MQVTQLYINNQRVDLFDDENISLTQTIQNVRDIEKVFTDFSKSFTIPASKTNNKIFKHYYNFDIDNGFDARKKVGATIELNNLPFRDGRVKLEGVDIKGNKPYSYRITFFGNTVNLKDKLGDIKLSALNWLDNFAQDYSEADVISTVIAAKDITVGAVTYIDAIACPLIYADGLVNYNSAGNITASDYLQYKYAIRLWLIVKAIEESGFDITFTDDSFIKQTDNSQYYNLYMWMHRSEGRIDTAQGEQLYNLFTPDSSSLSGVELTADNLVVTRPNASFTLSVNHYQSDGVTTGTDDYVVRIKNNGVVYAEESVEGGGDIAINGDLNVSVGGYKVFIEGTATDKFEVRWFVTFSVSENHNYGFGGQFELGSSFVFYPTEQIPEMTIIDFLSGLFKLFNLTAYEVGGKIKVETLNDFYLSGTTRDVTDFVDTSEGSVNLALPYKEVRFKYEGLDTYLAKQYTDKNLIGWGTVEFKGDDTFDGDVYEVVAPFEHLQYFNPLVSSGGYSSVQFGYMSDENIGSDKSYIGEPVIFYPVLVSSTNSVKIGSTTTTIFTIPSNSVSTNPAISEDTCHFSVEINENGRKTGFDGSLFANYYEDYISDVFNSQRRITKVKAQLPVGFLITYTLADKLRIATREYIINSITTNLNTGESELELLNVV
jgi:hypothetical protein